VLAVTVRAATRVERFGFDLPKYLGSDINKHGRY
jgi:hypothetical protein